MTDVVTSDEEIPEEKAVEEREPCLCGCGQVPTRKRSRFLPGHDAQLKARLYRVIRDEEAPEEQKAEAVERLDSLGWPQPAPKRSRKKAAAESTEGDEGEPPAEP